MASHVLFSHPRDAHITFDEPEHKYYVDGNAMKISVTGLIDLFFLGFDPDKAVMMMLNSKKFPYEQKHIKYHSMPIWCEVINGDKIAIDTWKNGAVLRNRPEAEEIIKDSWVINRDEASKDGTALHLQIELYIKYGTLPEQETIEFRYFMDYHTKMLKLGYIPFQSEQMVYDVDLQLAGCVDMMYIKDGLIFLVDWKRSKEIVESSTKKCFGLLSEYDACNKIKYSFQLNIYRELLEMHYGLKIARMAIVVFHPNNPSYREIEVDLHQMRPIVKQIFQNRITSLKSEVQ